MWCTTSSASLSSAGCGWLAAACWLIATGCRPRTVRGEPPTHAGGSSLPSPGFHRGLPWHHGHRINPHDPPGKPRAEASGQAEHNTSRHQTPHQTPPETWRANRHTPVSLPHVTPTAASWQTATPIPRFPPGAFSCRVDHRNQPSRSETTEKQCGTAPTACLR